MFLFSDLRAQTSANAVHAQLLHVSESCLTPCDVPSGSQVTLRSPGGQNRGSWGGLQMPTGLSFESQIHVLPWGTAGPSLRCEETAQEPALVGWGLQQLPSCSRHSPLFPPAREACLQPTAGHPWVLLGQSRPHRSAPLAGTSTGPASR